MGELNHFLSELAINSQKLGEFIHDSEAAMTAAELNDADKAALRSGFPPVINSRLFEENLKHADKTIEPGHNRKSEQSEAKSGDDGESSRETKRGSLVVIGTGIKTAGQLTVEAIAWMREADSLLYGVYDLVAEAVIKRLNSKGAVSLTGYYQEGKPRIDAYNGMVEHILGCVRAGDKTVAAFYGHPGVFVYPAHEAIRRAHSEGFAARMLPGVSSEDCLFADLGVDPSAGGCQSYEASNFLLNAYSIDPSSQLILWQIGTLGVWTYKRQGYGTQAVPLLVQRLAEFYPLSHTVTVYEAATLPGTEPMIVQIPLDSLSEFPITAATTLYVPPARTRTPDPEIQRLFNLANG